MMKRFSFPKEKRLVSNRQFKVVLARGRRLSNELLTLYMAENDCGYPRLGVSVGKSHGKAVARNRLKRLLREAFRQSQYRVPAGFDYVLMISRQRPPASAGVNSPPHKRGSNARATIREPTFEQINASFLALVDSR